MLDASGNLVTTMKVLEKLTVDMFTERLKSHKIKNHLKVHQVQRERLCENRIKEAQMNITPDCTEDNLDLFLKQLKNNKSRDHLGIADEVFMQENADDNLKLALLKMSNQIKK